MTTKRRPASLVYRVGDRVFRPASLVLWEVVKVYDTCLYVRRRDNSLEYKYEFMFPGKQDWDGQAYPYRLEQGEVYYQIWKDGEVIHERRDPHLGTRTLSQIGPVQVCRVEWHEQEHEPAQA